MVKLWWLFSNTLCFYILSKFSTMNMYYHEPPVQRKENQASQKLRSIYRNFWCSSLSQVCLRWDPREHTGTPAARGKTWWDGNWRTLILLLVWSWGADGQLMKYRTVVWTHMTVNSGEDQGQCLEVTLWWRLARIYPSQVLNREIVWDRGTEAKTQSYG